MKKQVLLAILVLLPLMASAYDIAVANADGVTIYYNWANNKTELSVCSGPYTGDVVIPESVTCDEKTYSVSSIGGEAFQGCSGLTSIEIPNSVTTIGNSAFNGCI
ncbi:MAG: leucine-rich repeat protein [Bacteroidaceae bacterium]|nr:leucine-rich repeat protein [Bacteroidaceae bacterium]